MWLQYANTSRDARLVDILTIVVVVAIPTTAVHGIRGRGGPAGLVPRIYFPLIIKNGRDSP